MLAFCSLICLTRPTVCLYCQTPAKNADDWVEVIRNDQRLKVKVTFNLQGGRHLDDLFDVLNKATGIPFFVAEPPEVGKIVFGGMVSSNAPAWYSLRHVALQFADGKWEKMGEGYILRGKPKNVLSPQQEKEEAAKLEARKKATAKAPRVLFDLPKGHPLRVDPKYNVPPRMQIKPPPDPPGPGPHHADLRLRKRVTINLG